MQSVSLDIIGGATQRPFWKEHLPYPMTGIRLEHRPKHLLTSPLKVSDLFPFRL